MNGIYLLILKDHLLRNQKILLILSQAGPIIFICLIIIIKTQESTKKQHKNMSTVQSLMAQNQISLLYTFKI